MSKKQLKKQLPAGMTPWKKGESGNPKGRPRKGSDLAGIMREYLDGTIDTEGGTITRGEALVKAIYKRAMMGGDGAQTKLLHYIEGMPVQRVETKEKKDNPFDRMTKDELIKHLNDIESGND